MKSLSRALLSFLALLLVYTAAAAQVGDKEKAKKEAERKQELKRKSYVLVDEIATGALSLKLPENRAFVLTESADLLWDHDEERARNLFRDANNVLALITPPATSDQEKQHLSAFLAGFGSRRDLILKVARRDPELALDLLRSFQQPPPELLGSNYLPNLEQEIAAEAAARDPKRAIQIARESLGKGLTFSVFNLLMRLHDLDTELSSRFAGELIDKLQTRNIATDIVASRLATELLISSRTPTESPEDKTTYRGEASPLKLSREQRRQLVEMIANSALGLSANKNNNLLYSITELMPEIEEFAPERSALLQKKVAVFNETLTKEQKGWQLHNSLVRNGTPEELLAASQDIDSEQRRWTQQQAIVLAVMRKRADALREYVNAEIKDDSVRKSLIDTLDTEQINSAINKGNADELRKLLPVVRLKEERARAMAEMALLLEKKGEHDEALKLLDEAQTLIKSDFSSDTQTNALLALVCAYALVEPARAFAIMEGAIDRANDRISKLILLDKVVRTGTVKKGEVILQNSGGISMEFVMLKYGKSVSILAKTDFDRTKGLVDRLGRNELRMMARLMLAHSLLREDKLMRMTGDAR
ncbi:MAG TPA: hypothetical protein VEW46_04605 [Pyrinomonadaceae bacterium]|nr:hypothetical protein [Pyrinomonadaceae bacterium]